MHGLYSPTQKKGKPIVDPNLFPDRLPIPTIPVRE